MREMFDKIAPKYDFITRVISYGMDGRWKRLGVLRASLPENALVLDLASGTGDFSRLVRERLPAARSVAVDLSEGMLRVGKRNGLQEAVCADATALPFASASFDCVFIGYGLRNFPNLAVAVREIERITRPGGVMVSLDFFLPTNRVFRQLYLGCMYRARFGACCCTANCALTLIFRIRSAASSRLKNTPRCCSARGTTAWMLASLFSVELVCCGL